MKYQNPILKGFNPDPSICRVEDDYYLITSTFEFFPCIPIYHSKDLTNWELINYCHINSEQMNLEGIRPSGGLYAPTIRYHNGTFYVVCTNVSGKGNYLISTTDIRGSWSNPIYINQGGIDPSLLFEGDKVYFCSTGGAPTDTKGGIYASEIDIKTGQRLTDCHLLTKGTGGKYIEAPHLYKINGYYYLMVAEGGTEFGHMETLFRSDKPFGPYTPCPNNPILSHRNVMNNPIAATGHADITDDTNGNFWLVCLAIRPLAGQLHNLGRETFLSPMNFDENGWFIVNQNKPLELEMEANVSASNFKKISFYDDFSGDKLNINWNSLRLPPNKYYSLGSEGIKICGSKDTLSDFHPAFLGIRQQEFCMDAVCRLKSDILNATKAGISAYYNKFYHYEIFITRQNGQLFASVTASFHGVNTTISTIMLEENDIFTLKITSDKTLYSFYCNDTLIYKLPVTNLCTETTMTTTFTGTYFGIFAENGDANFIDFCLNEK